MNVSPNEAEEALAAVQEMMQKTRRSIGSSGIHRSLIITGMIWMIGFICTQFLSGEILIYIWIGLSIVGSVLAAIFGIRSSKHVHIPTAAPAAKRIALTWVLLMFYCLAAIAVAWPLDGKQLTMFVNLFVLIGWMATGQQLSFSPIWPGLIVIVLLLVGYFLFPGIYYLWMAILGGGGLIALGVYIRTRW